MEPTTHLAVRSKSNGTTTVVVPRAHRPPRPLDWQQWAPTIEARYRSEPARILIDEMNAEGLHVTEKMFRDCLRRWGMNDKNRRSATNQRRRALQSAHNGNKTSKPGSHYNKIGHNSLRSAMLDQENIHNLLHTPKEMLVLQRVLKGVLDWQQHAQDSMIDLGHGSTFHDLLTDMTLCLFVSGNTPSMCAKITPHLWRTSAKLQSHMVTCNPLEVLSSVELLSYFVLQRYSSPWYHKTWIFLINAAVEAFPDSHPSLMLLRLLLSGLTQSQLVMVYEVGSDVIEQCVGEASSFTFRVVMHAAASRIGLGATIRSYADAMCAAIPNENDYWRLHGIAKLHQLMGQYEKAADAVRSYLAHIDEVDGDCSSRTRALILLASVQYEQNDPASEEVTLQKALEITLARDRHEFNTAHLSLEASLHFSDLDTFYAHHNLNEQRDALHLKYPTAFEL